MSVRTLLFRLFRRRPLPLLATVAAAAVLASLAGCGTARPGAAAIVGDHRVGVSAVQQRARDVAEHTAVGSDTQKQERVELTWLIKHQLLSLAAQRNGVSVSTGEVDQQVAELTAAVGGAKQLDAEAATKGIAPSEIKSVIHDNMLEIRLGQAVAGDTPVNEIDVAHILVTSEKLADTLVTEVKADPSSFAALVKQYSLDTATKSNGGDLGFQPVGNYPPAIQQASVGDVLKVQDGKYWHVVKILKKRSLPLGKLPADDPAVSTKAPALATAYLVKLAAKIGVTVNPRFGSWDAKQLVVGSPTDELSSPESPTPPPPTVAPTAPSGG